MLVNYAYQCWTLRMLECHATIPILASSIAAGGKHWSWFFHPWNHQKLLRIICVGQHFWSEGGGRFLIGLCCIQLAYNGCLT
jgi:hypothetical protein